LQIKDYRESYRELKAICQKSQGLYDSINVPSLNKKIEELEKETVKEDFWKDKERLASVNQELSFLRKKTGPWNELMKSLRESMELMEMALNENDNDILNEICEKIPDYKIRIDALETLELLSGEDDARNSFLTIHPGAGGTESQDWANMLLRMYCRWGEQRGFETDVIDYTPGEEAGIKTATINFKGDYAFGLLKSEIGVHRLVRISPFDANKRRHTSFASVEVIPEVSDDIAIDIRDTDIRIDTFRASGAGGQHVNRTDSAVRITHLPTGIVVQCQNERSQHKNKSFAMKVLKARLYEFYKREQNAKKLEKMGEKKDISWGNQIRSYVFQPYTMAKDHRTGEETGKIEEVMDGGIDRFIYSFLKSQRLGTTT